MSATARGAEHEARPAGRRSGVGSTLPFASDAVDRETALLARTEQIAHLGSWRYDFATKKTWWSDGMCRIFGLDPDFPPEDPIAAAVALIHPQDRGRALRMVATVAAGAAPGPGEFRLLAAGGAQRWIVTHGQQERDASGAVVAVDGIVQDTTEQRRTQGRALGRMALDRAVALLETAMASADRSIEELADLLLADAKEFTHSPLGAIRRQGADAAGRAAKGDAAAALACGPPSKVRGASYTNSPASDEALARGLRGTVPITCFLTAPAIAGGRLVGQIAVANAPGGYAPEDLQIVERLASLYAIALIGQEERARLASSDSSLTESKARFERMVHAVLEAMGRVAEFRDPYTQGHEVRVARLARQLAEEMHLPEHEVEGIEMAGLVHDIGKLSVPSEILTKPGVLSELEYALIKEHSRVGHTILKGIGFPWPVADIVLAHHERCDGSGYPNGLVGGDIIQEARVLGVADVVEAMASHRPYRPALGIGAAVAELEAHRSKYDPDVVSAFMALCRSGRIDLEEVGRVHKAEGRTGAL